MQKISPDAWTFLEGVLDDGMLIAAGGFGLCGIPVRPDNVSPFAVIETAPRVSASTIAARTSGRFERPEPH